MSDQFDDNLFAQVREKVASSRLRMGQQRGGELATIERITTLIEALSDLDQMLGILLEFAIDLSQGERGMIILVHGQKQELTVKAARNMDGEDLQQSVDISRTIVRQVFETRQSFLSMDAGQDERLRKVKSVERHGIKSLLCAPILIGEDSAIGVLYVDNQKVTGIFRDEQMRHLEAIARFAGVVIGHSQSGQSLREEVQRKEDEVAELRREMNRRAHAQTIIGNSPAMTRLLDLIETVADSSANILVIGESGTGKELIARMVHGRSRRNKGPFVAINCAALPETLLETELFGHEKGAFTNAIATKKGKFEQAEGGTLFLDEIGDMSPVTQAKVLRAIQEREFSRVGGNKTIRVDIRLIAATNVNLVEAVKAGDFREDLYFRLNVITLPVPPLRERRSDIPLLADHFLKKFAQANGKVASDFTIEAMDALRSYSWEGNVRELESAINHGVVLSEGGSVTLADLPQNIIDQTRSKAEVPTHIEEGLQAIKDRAIAELESRLLREYLEATDGNVAAAARMAKISRVNFYRLLKKHDLRR